MPRRVDRSGRFKNTNQSGFTFIELLIVVMILGVFAALSAPRLEGTFQSVRLNQSARDLADLIRYGQGQALLKNADFHCAYDRVARRFEVRPGLAPKPGDSLVGKENAPVKTWSVPEGITIEAPTGALPLSPDGTMGKARIKACRKGRCLTVSTEEQRGHVQVFEEES